MKKNLFAWRFILLIIAFVLFPYLSYTQVPTCDSNVPYHFVDLSANPSGTWVSPSHERIGKCCGVTGANACTSFEVKLSTNAVAVSLNIASGAMPSGALFYQIECGPEIPIGQQICLTGAGPHHITFCKPGNNENTYVITSIPKPLFPADTTVRIGCSKTLPVIGITASSIGWTSVYPGVEGQYNSYLSCTKCTSPVFTPVDGAPAYVDYKICGLPTVNDCGYTSTICGTVRVTINNRLTGTISPSPASFCQTGPGSGVNLTANAGGGNGSYNYVWRNSSSGIVGSSQSYFAAAQGNYTVEIRDGLYNSSTCPSTISSVSVTEAALPKVNAGTDQTVCATDARVNLNGKIQNATGATWSGGNGTFSPNNGILTSTYWPTNAEIASGSVKLILTSNISGNACPQVKDTINITFPQPLKASITSGTPSCSGSTTTLTATASGGITPYIYSWNTGSSSTSISVPPGTFCVTVTDKLGCNTTNCKTITAPAPLSITTSSTNVSINGGSDGSATAVVSGGVAPYTYLWSNSSTSSSITGLPYGVYTITVTDSRGCNISGSIVVNEPRCLGFNLSINHTDLACYGDNNASATAVATGGTGPYTYLWNDNNAQITPKAVNLSNGAYTVYVTDASGCITSRSVSITMPSPIINTFTYSDATNFSGNNGSATANPYGGTPAYTYSWGNGSSSQTISNLTPGKYHVNITDNKGCVYSDSIIINKDSCSDLRTSVVSTSPSCFGFTNGSATVFVNIGTPPYQYLWSNGATTNSISGLSSGTYSVTVTDATGCFSFRTFNVVQSAKLSVGLSPTDVICYGQHNGTIETTILGGNYPYSFSWSNGSSAEDLIYLDKGTYSVNITDASGCAISSSALVKEPAVLGTSYIKTDPMCNGQSNGSIDLTVTGGMVPYFYLWSNGATGQDLSGISSGLFSVKVTDANGCNLTTGLNINVSQPAVVAVDSALVSCPASGSNQTTVTVFPSGGNGGPYQVSFNNGTTFQTIGDYDAQLPIGATYEVIVRDGNNCTSPGAYSLIINPKVIVQSVTFNKCFLSNTINTSVTVVPSGGDGGPYQVSFDNGTTFETSGIYTKTLPIGVSYSIWVKDSSGCISTPFNIQIPAYLSASLTSSVYSGGFNISCVGNSNGAITTLTAGGTQPISYSWTGPGAFTSNTQSISGIIAGNYTVTATDANGCSITSNININEPAKLNVNLSSPSKSGGFNISCNGANDGVVTLNITGGDSTTYSYNWTGPNGFTSSSKSLSGLDAGTYSLVVTDANGCTASSSINITEPDSLSAIALSPTVSGGFNISCNGASNGSINPDISGGDISTYSFSWTGPNGFTSSSKSLSGLDAGTYNLVVTDANGCTASSSIDITEPDSLSALALSPTISGGFNISCNGAGNGSINPDISGGDISTYSFSWTGPNGFTSTSKSLSGLDAGTYSLVVTDANGCTASSSINITEPDSLSAIALSPTVSGGFNISCNGASNGSINPDISGGDISTYSFSWTGPNGFTSSSKSLSGLDAGTYNLVVTDANGCTASSSIDITEPDSLSALALSPTVSGGFNISCNGASNGSINPDISGGDISTYSFSWTGPNGFTSTSKSLSGLDAGTYTLVVTDANGCPASSSINITEPDSLSAIALSPTVSGGFNISCNGAGNGSINPDISGGNIATYSFSWTGPNGFTSTSKSLSGLDAGTYNLVVTDANGCTASSSINITEPDSLSALALSPTVSGGFNISCNGASNGSINPDISGGDISTYSFSWTGPNGFTSTSKSLSGLDAGTYNLVVTDANGCTASSSINITEPDSLSAIALSPTVSGGFNISCNGASNGSINPDISGGDISTYSFSWTGPNGFTSSSKSLSGLDAGTYTLVVTDANGCTASSSITLTKPDSIAINFAPDQFNATNISCNGANDGAIALGVTGGDSTTYFYNWTGPNGFTSDAATINNLYAGTYNLLVADSNGCDATSSVTLVQPDSLLSFASVSSNYNGRSVSCAGSSDGLVDLTTSGGTLPYSYFWSNSSTTEDLQGITAGNYAVNITDANGCQSISSVTLTEPQPILGTVVITDVLCNGYSTGGIDLTISGGTNPYNYLWTSGETSEDIFNHSSGAYSVTVTDNNQCTFILNASIIEESPIILNVVSTNETCFERNNGTAQAIVTGGTMPYTFLWSNGMSDANIAGLEAGAYVVTVTDSNNCFKPDSITITQPDSLIATVSSPLYVNGHNVTHYQSSDGSIEMYVNGGTVPYAYSWNNGTTIQSLSQVPAGVYNVIVTDTNGCLATVSITLSQPDDLAMPTGFSPNGDNKNDIFLVHGLEAYPDNKIVVVNRWGSTVFKAQPYHNDWRGNNSSGEELPDDTYFVVLTINGENIILKGYVDVRR